jgi:large subunit ribosomal protein L6
MLQSLQFVRTNNNFFSLTDFTSVISRSSNQLTCFPNHSGSFFTDSALLGSALSLYKRFLLTDSIGYYSVLHVKGIGFKVFYFRSAHALYFILGYNHVVKFTLSKRVLVRVRKQYLLFFSYDKQTFGQTICRIRLLRFPDPYRGKGIRFRFQVMNFKAGKQR